MISMASSIVNGWKIHTGASALSGKTHSVAGTCDWSDDILAFSIVHVYHFSTPITLGAFSRDIATTLVNCGENRIFDALLLRDKSATSGSQQTERGHGNASALSQDRTDDQQPLCLCFQITNPAAPEGADRRVSNYKAEC
jgi:hypothetical protein